VYFIDLMKSYLTFLILKWKTKNTTLSESDVIEDSSKSICNNQGVPKEMNDWLRVFNATLKNIYFSYIVAVNLLVKETGENHDMPQVTYKFYHIMLYTSPWWGFELTTLVVIWTNYIGISNSNYRTITTTTIPVSKEIWRFINVSTVRSF
jgi:hypothetical protein